MASAPDLLSILASNKDAGVAAVAVKAMSYQRDVERMQTMTEGDGISASTAESWRNLVFAYGIVVRELSQTAQELKEKR